VKKGPAGMNRDGTSSCPMRWEDTGSHSARTLRDADRAILEPEQVRRCSACFTGTPRAAALLSIPRYILPYFFRLRERYLWTVVAES
jgi:hypothetical protein